MSETLLASAALLAGLTSGCRETPPAREAPPADKTTAAGDTPPSADSLIPEGAAPPDENDLPEDFASIRAILLDGRVEEAEAAAQAFLNKRRQEFGAVSRETAEGLDLMHRVCRVKGNDLDPGCLDWALAWLEVMEQVVGTNHPDLVGPLRQIATIKLEATRELRDVEEIVLRILAIAARRRLAHLTLRVLDAEDPAADAELLQQAIDDRDRAERALADESLPHRLEIERREIGLSGVEAALPPGAALVAFAQYRHGPRRSRVMSPSYGGGGANTAAPSVVPLGAAEGIEALVQEWKRLAGGTTGGPFVRPEAAEEEYRQAAAALRRAVWDPLVPALQGAEQVFIVPAGALHLVSFATLPVGRDGYLVETGPLVHYLSAERDLPGKRDRPRGGNALLAIGGPDFEATPQTPAPGDTPVRTGGGAGAEPTVPIPFEVPAGARPATYRSAAPACDFWNEQRFDPLPHARLEAEEVAAHWREQGEVGITGPAEGRTAVYLTGGAASEAAFKRLAPQFDILHLATHAFFIHDRCRPLSERRADADRGLAAGALDNPLLLSGLALAGANRRRDADAGRDNAAIPPGAPGSDPGTDDGILTAEEIASLDLSSARWVVLSACETGVGDIQSGEGVLGLCSATSSLIGRSSLPARCSANSRCACR